MKTKRLPDNTQTPVVAASIEGQLSLRQQRQRLEELKVKVRELAEQRMDLSLRILRSWLNDS